MKALTPPKRPKTKRSISSDTAYKRKQTGDQYFGSRTTFYPDGTQERWNKKGFLEENASIPVGSASKKNKVRWKKPNPVIKKSTKKK